MTRSQVDRLARDLTARLAPLPRHAPCVLAAPNGVGFLVGYLALRRAQLVPVLADPSSPGAELDRIARRFAVAAIVRLPAWPEAALDADVIARSTSPPALERIGVVKLTSGSTGQPRGVAVQSASLLADVDALQRAMEIRSDDRLVAAVPLGFSYGLSSVALMSLAHGNPIAVPDPADPLGALRIAELVDGPVVLPTVPPFVRALAELDPAHVLPDAVRLVVTAGSPLDPDVAVAFRRRTGRPAHVFYGASECGGITFDRQGDAAERGTAGTPVDGVVVTLDHDGAVTVRSPAVADGYLPDHDPHLAAGAFRTSDRGRWAGAELELLGRTADWIDVGGRKVDPREVERTLRGLPGIDDVVVVGRRIGSTGRLVCHAFVATLDPRLGRHELVRHCNAHLAPHKVPRTFTLVDRIPSTDRGKIDRATLQAWLAAEADDAVRGEV